MSSKNNNNKLSTKNHLNFLWSYLNNNLFSNNNLNFLWSYGINYFKSSIFSSILILIFGIINNNNLIFLWSHSINYFKFWMGSSILILWSYIIYYFKFCILLSIFIIIYTILTNDHLKNVRIDIINYVKPWMGLNVFIIIFYAIKDLMHNLLMKDFFKKSYGIPLNVLSDINKNTPAIKNTSYGGLMVFSLIILIVRYFVFMRLMDKPNNSSKPLGIFKTILLCFLGFLFLMLVFSSGILNIIMEVAVFIYLYRKQQKNL